MFQTELNIDNVTKLPKNLQLDNINDLINILSEDNKKKLTLSLLNEKIKYGKDCLDRYNTLPEMYRYYYKTITINIIIHLLLRYNNRSFMIYPINLNITHFILFNNLNVNNLLKFMILLYYNKYICISMDGYTELNNYSINMNNIFLSINNNTLFKIFGDDLYNSINLNIINLDFNNDYDKLLFDKDYNYPSIYEQVSSLQDDYSNIFEKVFNINNSIEILDNNQTNFENKISILEDKITNLIEHNKLLENKISNLENDKINILEDKIITNLKNNITSFEYKIKNKILLFLMLYSVVQSSILYLK